jgi:hypothetical protein
MLADRAAPADLTRWELEVPGGVVVVDGELATAPGGVEGFGPVDAWIERTLRPRFRVDVADVGTTIVLGAVALGVLAMWTIAVVLLVGFATSQILAPPPPISGGGW